MCFVLMFRSLSVKHTASCQSSCHCPLVQSNKGEYMVAGCAPVLFLGWSLRFVVANVGDGLKHKPRSLLLLLTVNNVIMPFFPLIQK